MEIISKAFLEDKAKAINHLKNQIAENVIEIGRHLSEAREMCEGESWQSWLQRECGFTRDHANRYIKIYTKFRNRPMSTLNGLEKLSLLASLPDDKSEELIESHDIENTTVRQLKELIKAQTVTEAEKQQIKILADKEAEERYKERMDNLQRRIDDARERKKRVDEELFHKNEELRKAHEDLRGKSELEKIKKDIDNLKQLRSDYRAELERAGMLGELKADIDELLRRLAPAKYQKLANPDSDVMKRALQTILEPVKRVVSELETILGI